MAVVGFFDPLVRPEAWFDPTAVPLGWYHQDLIDSGEDSPPAEPNMGFETILVASRFAPDVLLPY